MAISTKSFPMSLFRFLKPAPCKGPQNPAGALRASRSIEEERTPYYNPRHFYPMHLHTILANRYQASAKLGRGISSTVWLAKDLHQWRWLPPRSAIKMNANNYQSQESADHELRITRHITQANPTHEGRNFVRTLLDTFELQGPHGSHVCMVFDVLYEPLWIFKARFKRNVLPLDVLKVISPLVIKGLHYLHTKCHIIHTDLKADNILMALRNQLVLDRVSQDEIASPLPQKKSQDRIIYLSRSDFGFQVENLGRPVITDLVYRFLVTGGSHNHPIQSNSFRAPEVVIGANWGYSVDIWNFGGLFKPDG